MLFVRYKFRHIEQNNTTLCTHFSNLSPVRVWHLLTTQQNGAVSSLYSKNCSGAPSIVWNPHFILAHLVRYTLLDFYYNSDTPASNNRQDNKKNFDNKLTRFTYNIHSTLPIEESVTKIHDTYAERKGTRLGQDNPLTHKKISGPSTSNRTSLLIGN